MSSTCIVPRRMIAPLPNCFSTEDDRSCQIPHHRCAAGLIRSTRCPLAPRSTRTSRCHGLSTSWRDLRDCPSCTVPCCAKPAGRPLDTGADLTAADGVSSGSVGLDLGADDFGAKPFSLRTPRGTRGTTRPRCWARPPDRAGTARRPSTRPAAWSRLNDQMPWAVGRGSGFEVLLQRQAALAQDQPVDGYCEWGGEVSNNAIWSTSTDLRKKIQGSGHRHRARAWATA